VISVQLVATAAHLSQSETKAVFTLQYFNGTVLGQKPGQIA